MSLERYRVSFTESGRCVDRFVGETEAEAGTGWGLSSFAKLSNYAPSLRHQSPPAENAEVGLGRHSSAVTARIQPAF